MPERIQLRRTKDWRKPEGAIVVARPTRWGNPYYVGLWDPEYLATHDRVKAADPGSHIETVERAVELFRQNVAPGLPVHELAGKDLACWCPIVGPDGKPVPCHADVLLDLANAAEAVTP